MGGMSTPLAGGQSQPGASDDQLYGLLQFSCSLPMPGLSNSESSVLSRAVTVGDVRERQRGLRYWLIPPGGGFEMYNLTRMFKYRKENKPPEHSWLHELSRHSAIRLRDYSARRADRPLPAGFPAALDWHCPEHADSERGGGEPWTHYLRVQRARDDVSQRFTTEIDCNDFLIRVAGQVADTPAVEPGSLAELQLFFCEFLAQRRGAIFASHVSERIYNIWLPPGVVTLDDAQRPGQHWSFAILPVVTVIRRPYRTDWRYALSVTIFFVPWWSAAAEALTEACQPRLICPQEIFDVVTSTSGNSTYLRDSGGLRWRLADKSPLRCYLRQVTADDRRDACYGYDHWDDAEHQGQTLRHWIELLFLTVAELPREWEERADDRLAEPQPFDDQIVPDEVLRCLRVNGLWSTMLVSDSFAACTDSSTVADGRWWPQGMRPAPDRIGDLTSGMPSALSEIFTMFADRNHGFPPSPDDRIDGVAFAGRNYLTWRIPTESVIVTAYSLADDAFPWFSSLYQVGWFAYMAVGVTCAWQTMYSLTHETDRLRDVAELSELGHNRIMDLEDVYEFDVAWPAYASFYRRLRSLLGVDQEYAEIKERLELLFRFAQVEQRTREEHLRDEEIAIAAKEQRLALSHSHRVESAAAIVGGSLLLISLAGVLATYTPNVHSYFHQARIAAAVIFVLGAAWVLRLIRQIRKIKKGRDEARLELERLGRSLGSGSGSGRDGS